MSWGPESLLGEQVTSGPIFVLPLFRRGMTGSSMGVCGVHVLARRTMYDSPSDVLPVNPWMQVTSPDALTLQVPGPAAAYAWVAPVQVTARPHRSPETAAIFFLLSM